jgi:hypothetical protein
MDTFTQKANEIKKQNTEILNNLVCIGTNQINTTELEILTRSIEILAKSQTIVVKQIEQNMEYLETLTVTVNRILDELNGKYKFI